MPLTISQLNSYLTTIKTHASSHGSAQSDIGNYYIYLQTKGIDYGSLAYDTSQDIGDFGQFANDMIEVAGASSATQDSHQTALDNELAQNLGNVYVFWMLLNVFGK